MHRTLQIIRKFPLHAQCVKTLPMVRVIGCSFWNFGRFCQDFFEESFFLPKNVKIIMTERK